MPATVGTINALGIEPNTDECHTLAIIACGASNLTTVLLILIGMLLSVPLYPVLTAPALQPAFNMALPALFGGICAQNVFKKKPLEWALWLIPLGFALFFTYIVKISAAYMMFIVTIIGAVVWFAKEEKHFILQYLLDPVSPVWVWLSSGVFNTYSYRHEIAWHLSRRRLWLLHL